MASEKDIVAEAREMAEDYRYDIQPSARRMIRALADEVERLRNEIAEFERTDLVPRSRYDAANANWLEAKQQTQDLAKRAKTEIERLEAQLSEKING